MSAQYILRYRGQPVRVLALPGRAGFEIVPRAMATVFISQADAWHKAYELDLQPDLLAILRCSDEHVWRIEPTKPNPKYTADTPQWGKKVLP